MKQHIYADNAATTKLDNEAFEAMIPWLTEEYGNASQPYAFARKPRKALLEARATIAKCINALPEEIFFTSGGTESDNWAIKGSAFPDLEKRATITSAIEHHAILNACAAIERLGYPVAYVYPQKDGVITSRALSSIITDRTRLVSVMFSNNEIGTVQPIKELAAVAKAKGVLFHTDAVQGLGNVPIDVKELGVDFLSMSAHKIYGPKGIGALYTRKGVRISNFIHGGAQESKKRAGTENSAGIVGFGKAAELAREGLENHIVHSSVLRDALWQKIEANIPDVHLNGPRDRRHPGNLNVSFDYIEGEAILLMLDAYGISVSTGSACSSKSLAPSHVLDAIGVPITRMNGTVRFTVGDFTTPEDIDYVVDALTKVVTRLRELSPVTGQEGW